MHFSYFASVMMDLFELFELTIESIFGFSIWFLFITLINQPIAIIRML